MMLKHLFLCLLALYIHSLKNAYSNPLLIWIVFCCCCCYKYIIFFLLNCENFKQFGYKSLLRYMTCKISPPILSSTAQIFFNFDEAQVTYIFFHCLCFWYNVYKAICLTPDHEEPLLCFKSFIPLALTFSSIVQFYFIR